MPRIALVALAVILALPIIVLGSRLNLGGAPDASTVVVGRDPLMDTAAPAISLATVDGSVVALADYRGRPVIVNFWASWCVPCRDEFPLLAAARAAHQADGLEILGVIHDDSAQSAAAFAATYDAAWPLLMDADDAAWNAYHGAFVPVSYFVDRAGVVRAVSYGPPPSESLDALLAKIL
ncbi:MAG: cytochrome c biosis protein CcmG, thiol:disulfide interchange protein DsbE [Chloroflexota bacterium]|nr:cytochrome c biosis protein CcmG, thiol:disulfide interchange protein DsbE [Chloroflexota bacterium]